MGTSSGITLGEIAERLDLTCAGDASLTITGLGTLAGAGPGDLSFLANPRYQKQLADTRAGAVILHRDMAGATEVPALLAEDPYLAFARATALFDSAPRLQGVHERAVVADSAELGEGVAVGANAVIGEGAVVGEGSVIHPGAVIGANVRIGARCVIFANVSIYHDVRLGDDVRVHSGVVIGGDGFGFAPEPSAEKGAWTKIHQLGSVVIGDRVEIGAGTTIDRGALDDTVIGSDVILDSQVIIAHNVVVGDGTAFAGRAAVAGSAIIGRNCTIAGGAGIVGHIELADGVHVSACTLVTKSVLEQGASVSSGTPLMSTADWRKSAVRFSQLETLSRRLSKLEKQLKE